MSLHPVQPPQRGRRSLSDSLRAPRWRRATLWLGLGAAALAAIVTTHRAVAQAAPAVPAALSTLARPEPANLGDFVADRAAAIALGKALFWDARLGSDGKTACASCHFHAGADPRSKNQLSAGANGAGLSVLQSGAVNYQFKASDFPLHQLADPTNRDSAVLRSLSVVASSQGVVREQFSNIVPGSGEEARQVVYDPVFHVGALNTRQVEPRNTPTVINAVFNLRNFWDGRAQSIFNGVNPWGKRDASARVYKNSRQFSLFGSGYRVQPTEITLNDSSLASQASGPPMSTLEMAANGRAFPELGRKMYALRPLADQAVAADDSVLASRRHASGLGLATADYATLVKAAFRPEWWNGTQAVTQGGRSYSQIEANFSLFFGLAVQLYEATLVSDQAPYDRWAQGDATALTPQQQLGLGVFMGKGRCIQCHAGAAFTNAAIVRRPLATKRLNQMLMGNGGSAVYDEGFYNIGITRTGDDAGVGGKDPFGNPLSFSGVAKAFPSPFTSFEQDVPNVLVTALSRIAVNGAFKTPTLRNVELTAPYFHNGGAATLTQVVEFYDRGGNFARNNIADLDADIQPLGLTVVEKEALVAFLRSLTDDRVRRHAAPFDHPQLVVSNGHVGDNLSIVNDGAGRGVDALLTVPAVGRGGYAAGAAPLPFLGIRQ